MSEEFLGFVFSDMKNPNYYIFSMDIIREGALIKKLLYASTDKIEIVKMFIYKKQKEIQNFEYRNLVKL